MSIESDHYADCLSMIRDHWFPHHIAIFQKFVDAKPHETMSATVDCMRWCKPGTSTYLVSYFIYGNTLTVMGDVGHAIYRWTQAVTFEWIAHTDYSYFASKLEGINGSADPRRWDAQICEKRAARLDTTLPHYWRNSTGSATEWAAMLHQTDIDYDALSAISELGFVPNNRIIGHWAGLRMAFSLPLK